MGRSRTRSVLSDSPAAWDSDSGTRGEELQRGGRGSQTRVSERPRGPGGEGAGAQGGECGGVSWPGTRRPHGRSCGGRDPERGPGGSKRTRGAARRWRRAAAGQERAGSKAAAAGGVQGGGERASGGGGRRRRRGWGSGLGGCAGSASAAAARARGAGGSAPRARPLWEPLPSAPLSFSPGRAQPPPPPLLLLPAGLPCSGSQGKARGAGLAAGSLPVRGCAAAAGRGAGWRGAAAPEPGRPAAAGRRVDRRGHRGRPGLAPAAPAAGAGERRARGAGGLPAADAARARGRRVLREDGTLSPPGPGETACGSGRGPAREDASQPQISAAGPGTRSAFGRASAWRGPALCQPRAAGTRTHPRRPGLPGAPLPHRGEGVGAGGGRAAAGEPGEVSVAHRAYGLGSGLGAWARAPVNRGLME